MLQDVKEPQNVQMTPKFSSERQNLQKSNDKGMSGFIQLNNDPPHPDSLNNSAFLGKHPSSEVRGSQTTFKTCFSEINISKDNLDMN